MEVRVLSPDKTLYEGRLKKITLPGENGQFQVLEGHADIFALLSDGEIIIDENRKIPISSGAVEVLNNRAIILVKN